MVENMSLDTDVEVEESETESKERIEKARRIALKHFPQLGPRERIGVAEIKRRLAEIRDAGYYVKPYSHMDRAEAWGYLGQIRQELKNVSRRPAYFNT
ncbi:MAG: hypothetical protein Q7R52_00830 [archaeon]|nr:hypothetical protein [archaeon]